MAGPWENYQTPAAAQPASGPWLRYQSPAGTPGGYTPASNPADAYRSGTTQPLSNEEWYQMHPETRDWAAQYGFPDTPQAAYRARQHFDPEGFRTYQQWLGAQGPEAMLADAGQPHINASPTLTSRAEMAGRTLAQGLTFGNLDNIMAATGHQRAADIQNQLVEGYRIIDPTVSRAIEIAGSAIPMIIPGTIAAKLGAGARALTATETAAGAVGGAAAGWGNSDPNAPISERLGSMAVNGVLGAIGGRLGAEAAAARPGATPAAIAAEGDATATTLPARVVRPNVPAETNPGALFARQVSGPAEEFRAAARTNYQAMEQSGLTIAPNSFDNLGARFDIITEPARFSRFDSVKSIASEISELRGGSLSYNDLEGIRQSINDEIAGATNPKELRALGQLRAELDNYINNLDQKDFLFNANQNLTPEQARTMVAQARADWRTGQKIDILDEITRRAELAPAGTEDRVIVRQLRSILLNENERAYFTDAELQAMVDIVNGDKTAWGRFLNYVGRFAPNRLGGIIGGITALGTGNVAATVPLIAGAAATRAAGNRVSGGFANLYNTAAASMVPLAPGAQQAIAGGAGAAGGQGLFGFPVSPQ